MQKQSKTQFKTNIFGGKHTEQKIHNQNHENQAYWVS